MSPRRGAVGFTVLCLTAGCYNYRPLAAPSPEPGSYIAATLTDQGAMDLARYLGPNVYAVRGRYLGASDEGISLAVSSVELQRGDDVGWAGETITLPPGAVRSLDVRRLAKGRTLLLASAGAGGLVLTTLAAVLVGNSTAVQAGGGHTGKK
jgi:hypothetical protein